MCVLCLVNLMLAYSMEQTPLEKLTCFQLVKKFPAFYGTRRFITTHTSAYLLSLSWCSSIQSIPPHPTSWKSILVLSSHLCLGQSYALWFYYPNNSWSSARCTFSHLLVASSLVKCT